LATTTKRKKKAPATRGHKAAKRARRSAKNGANEAATDADKKPDERDFFKHEAAIRAVSRDDRVQGRYSLEDTVDIAIQSWERMREYEDLMPGFDEVVPGTKAAFEALPEYARALRYANHQYAMAQGSESNARVPVEIVEETKTLTSRMAGVIKYNLGEEPKMAVRLAFLASGIGYRHSTIELTEYATIYETRADDLAVDKRRYNPADAVRARELALEITNLIGRPKSGGLVEWADLRAGAHTLLVEAYDRLIRLLAAVEHDRPRSEYPALGSAVRAMRAPRTGRRSDDDDEGEDAAAPATPAPSTPDDDDLDE
jgi:hypothetical protein